MKHQRIVLAARPTAEAAPEHFRLETVATPDVQDGHVLVKVHYLSLDPYMRMRMNDGKSYAAPVAIGEVMVGGTVGEVVASEHEGFVPGDRVVCMGGWQEMVVLDASVPGAVRKVDAAPASAVPLSAYLGAVGMPGVTAWVGLNHIIEPKAGETVVVSAASGAVGSVLGQLAKAQGCRVVGLAGGAKKCDYVVRELGFDACIDYRQHPDFKSLAAALDEAAPQGVDGNFENVGGLILDVVLSRMNAFGRVALCGLIAGYDGQSLAINNARLLLTQRLKLQGFIVSEHMALWPAALKELGSGVASGHIKYRESVAQGLAAAPEAFIGLLKGRNFGKQLVKLL
ncbi:MAG: NADP-dependent oxidoreductase [Rubrivivax sp.]|nr:NADP-dependent oxidoreductase [Rubrivivax sp.]